MNKNKVRIILCLKSGRTVNNPGSCTWCSFKGAIHLLYLHVIALYDRCMRRQASGERWYARSTPASRTPRWPLRVYSWRIWTSVATTESIMDMKAWVVVRMYSSVQTQKCLSCPSNLVWARSRSLRQSCYSFFGHR